MPKKTPYKTLVMKYTGMSEKTYNRLYSKFKAQTQNYNIATGSHYSAAREFYYSYIYADNPSAALVGIMQTPATRAHAAGAKAAEVARSTRARTAAETAQRKTWYGLSRRSGSRYVEELYARLDPNDRGYIQPGAPGYLTPAQVAEKLAYYVKERKRVAAGEPIYDAAGNLIEYKSTDVTAGSP